MTRLSREITTNKAIQPLKNQGKKREKNKRSSIEYLAACISVYICRLTAYTSSKGNLPSCIFT